MGLINFRSLDISVAQLGLTAVALLLVFAITQRYRYGISHIPGPFFASILDISRLRSVISGASHKLDLATHQKYGPIVRLAPNLISVADPAAIPQFYGVTSKFYKSKYYVPFTAYDEEGIIPDPFVLTDRKLHSRMKKNAGSAYAMSSIVKMERFADRETDKMFKAWDELYMSTGKAFDIGRWMIFYSFDAVFALTFGKDFGFIDERADQFAMMKVMEQVSVYGAVIGQIPSVHYFVDKSPFLQGLAFGSEFTNAFNQMMGVAEAQVKELREKDADLDSAETATFVERLLQTQKLNPDSLNDREINTHAMGNISAGGDTTSIALRAIIVNILKRPDVHSKFMAELDAADLNIPVSYEEANRLPYLNAVIRESMRLHPSVGLILARTVPKGGVVVNGVFIPEGVDIGINPYIVHRDKELFPDPENFIPERWLTKDEDLLARMNRAYLTFGHGPHTCSGRHISLMEINKLIPMLFLRYSIKLVQPTVEPKVRNYWFMFWDEINVQITPRVRN